MARETVPIALFDMDATLADFGKSMSEELAKLRGPDEPTYEGVDRDELPEHIKARRALIKKVPGFWRGLERIQAGFHIFDLVVADLGFEAHILTKGPRRSTIAWTEKAEWCQEHVPEAAITITMDKGLVYGRVLVDDWPPYIMDWLEWRPRGLVVMIDWPHNQTVKDEEGNHIPFEHPNIFRYHRHRFSSPEWSKQFQALRERLVAARDR